MDQGGPNAPFSGIEMSPQGTQPVREPAAKQPFYQHHPTEPTTRLPLSQKPSQHSSRLQPYQWPRTEPRNYLTGGCVPKHLPPTQTYPTTFMPPTHQYTVPNPQIPCLQAQYPVSNLRTAHLPAVPHRLDNGKIGVIRACEGKRSKGQHYLLRFGARFLPTEELPEVMMVTDVSLPSNAYCLLPSNQLFISDLQSGLRQFLENHVGHEEAEEVQWLIENIPEAIKATKDMNFV